MAYIVSNDYKTTIYSGSAQNKAYISFNNVELEDADNYLEKITISSRCIPNSGSGFYLDNLISKEVTMILHDLPSNLQLIDQVELKIGTLVNNNYEYVPIGIFNIQDIPTTDGKVTTIKLRDNSVKLDFNYNAKTLIDNNNGSATFLQILNNICLQVGIEYVGSQTFLGYDISVGIYDNTIKGRTYISYIAEQAGCLPIINRLGQLDFIPLNSLTTYRIPLSIVESYKIGDLFKITRVCYESGIIKFENPTIDDVSNTNDTLYLDSSNPYINTQEQIDNIKTIVNNFEFYSLSTGKILGNPAIDSYDIIEIYDDNNENETTISKTLATNTLTYTGVMTQTFDTTITKEEKGSNVSTNSEATYKKLAKTEIDNINATVKIQTSSISTIQDNLTNNYYTQEQTNTLVQTATDGLTNTLINKGGNNFWRNTYFNEVENNTLTFWNGNISNVNEIDSSTKTAGLLPNGQVSQTISLPNGTYTNKFKFKKLISTANCTALYNNRTILLNGDVGKEVTIETTGNITSGSITILFTCDTSGGFEFYELMLNNGSEASVYTQNQNETISNTVNIGKGIQVENSAINSYTRLDADGLRGYNNKTNETVFYQTTEGLYGKKLTTESIQSGNLIITTRNKHNFLSGI